jgi:hypothetical protein
LNWQKILDATNSREFPEAVLPHPTRYVVDQGNYVPRNQRFKILKARKCHYH